MFLGVTICWLDEKKRGVAGSAQVGKKVKDVVIGVCGGSCPLHYVKEEVLLSS